MSGPAFANEIWWHSRGTITGVGGIAETLWPVGTPVDHFMSFDPAAEAFGWSCGMLPHNPSQFGSYPVGHFELSAGGTLVMSRPWHFVEVNRYYEARMTPIGEAWYRSFEAETVQPLLGIMNHYGLIFGGYYTGALPVVPPASDGFLWAFFEGPTGFSWLYADLTHVEEVPGPVPEPGSMVLVGDGLLGAAGRFALKRKRKAGRASQD